MKNNLKKIIEWLIYMIGYTLVLITITILFPKTIFIDNSFYGLWSLIATIIIYTLNKTIKPLIVWLTIPITAITLGLSYPFINIMILYIVSYILGNHFKIIGGITMTFIVATTLSIMDLITKKIIKNALEGVTK